MTNKNGGTFEETGEQLGFDETKNYSAPVLAKLVPNTVAKRVIGVSVTTDRETYTLGEPITIQIKFKNRLPVPVKVPTPRNRRWGWKADEYLEATNEKRYVRKTPSTFDFRARERKTIVRSWDGRIHRPQKHGPDRFEPVERGDHSITAFLATGDDDSCPSAETTIRIT
jgi:hypothetical protein